MDDKVSTAERENGIVRRTNMLEFIKKFYLEHGYGPSYRELCKETGLKTTSAVTYHLVIMQENGDITYDYRTPRSIVPTAAKTIMVS